MDDDITRWELDDLLVLDEYAFVHPMHAPGHESYSVCFWFRVDILEGKQVIANQGAMHDRQAGWCVFLEDDTLHFSVRFDDLTTATAMTAISGPSRWHHFAGVIDRQQGRLVGYLDGSNAGWRGATLHDHAVSPAADLIIGGYTDPAGGHFDHTFGRNGTGLVDDFRVYRRALSPDEAAAFVDETNHPPTAAFTASSTSGRAPTTIHFDASPSHDPDGTIRAYLWDFGDGHSGHGVRPEHHYPYAGTLTVRLTVIDDDHAQASAEQTLTLHGEANPLRIVPVFVNGAEGYACYRIPAIVRAINGDLIAFAEGRVESCSDSTRTIHIVCKRSTDHGRTWGPVQVVGRNVVGDTEFATQNPSPVVDTVGGTGRIVVLFNKIEHSEWELARGIGTSRIYCVYSDDNGVTWRGERDITPSVHRSQNADWRVQRPTLGHAIQLTGLATRGRLFYAGTMTQGDRSVFESQNYTFWSDDMGETWTIGGVIPRIGLNEASAVERENGDVMINSRGYRYRQSLGRRAITIGTFDADGQITFEETYLDEALVDPAVQASTIRYTRRGAGQSRNRILFSNPAHPRARRNMTVRLSYDEGRTWPVSKTIDSGPAAYSDLVIQDDMRIGLLYERGNQGGIHYVNFTLDWLSDGQDTLS